MVQVRRISPDDGVSRVIKGMSGRIQSLETRSSGNIVIRDSLSTTDPETGVETIIGRLPNGEYGFKENINDITPPDMPSTPTASGVLGGVSVTWDGLAAGGLPQPRDYARTEIQYRKPSDSDWAVGTVIYDASTAIVPNLTLGVSYQISLVSFDSNNNESERSSIVTATPVAIMDNSDVADAIREVRDEAEKATRDSASAQDAAQDAHDAAAEAAREAASIAAGASRTIFSDTEPLDPADRTKSTLWINTSGTPAKNTPMRWNGTKWVAVTDSKAQDAADAAARAEDIANAASATAAAAARVAGDAQTAADGKNRVWYLPTAPAGNDHSVGDTWFDQSTGNTPMIWDGTAWVSAQDKSIAAAAAKADAAEKASTTAGTTASDAAKTAQNAATAAGAKGKVIIQSQTPSAEDQLPQNLWINTTGGENTPMRWNATSKKWEEVSDKKAQNAADTAARAEERANLAFNNAATAAENAGLAQESANGKNRVWYSETKPTGVDHALNDIWYDSANGNRPMRWNGTDWLSVQDKVYEAIEESVEKVTSSANGKNSIYYSGTAPVSTTAKPLVVGDTWFDTASGNRVKVWTGSPAKWTDAVDKAVTDAADLASAARSIADGKNTTYYQSSAPTATATKALIKGDTWFDTDDNYALWTYTGAAWQKVQDAAAALTAANGKNKSSTGATAPASPVAGDIWVDTGSGNIIKVYGTNGWASYQDKAIATVQGVAEGALTSANGKNIITYNTAAPTVANGTGRIAGDTWFRQNAAGDVIGQWTWDGAKWVATQHGHEVIASIDAAKISTGTMDAKYITANTITTDQMLVGFGTNMIPNPGFESGIEPHGAISGSTASWSTVDPNNGARSIISTNTSIVAGTFVFVFSVRSGVTRNSRAGLFEVKAGTDYVVRFSAKSFGTPSAGARARAALQFYNAAGTAIGSVGGTALTLTAAWQPWEWSVGKASIPAGTAFVALSLQTDASGSVQHDDWFFGEKINGSLLVKGSITADLGILGEAVVGTAEIEEAAITTAKIDDLAVTDAKIGSLHAGKIDAGELNAARIGAKSISVDKLLVSSTDNIISDGDFSDPKGVSWGGYHSTYFWDETGGRNGGSAQRIVNNDTQQGRYNLPDVPTSEGNAYRVGAWIKSSVAIPARGAALFARQRKVKGGTTTAYSVWTNDEAMAANTWHWVSGIITVAKDMTLITFGVYSQAVLSTGEFWCDSISATRAADGSLVVDGSITSNSVTTDGLDAGVIKFGSMDGGLIKADSITSASLAVSDLTNFAPNLSGAGANEWQLTGGATIVTSSTSDGKRFHVSSPPGTAWVNGPLKDVTPGDKLYASATPWRDAGSSVNIYFRYYFYDSDKTELTGYVQAPSPLTATSFEMTATVPAGASYGRIRAAMVGTGAAGLMQVRGWKQSPSTLIEKGAITTDHMTAGTIDGKVITGGTIKGAQIEAKTISTDNLLITSTDNLIQEADFGAKGIGWTLIGTTAINSAAGRNGGPALRFTAASGVQTVYNKYTASVEPGNVYRLTAWIKPSVALAANTFTFMAVSSTAAGAKTYLKTYAPAIAAGTWKQVTGVVTIPDTSSTLQFALELPATVTSGTIDVDFASATRASDGELIVEGSVTTKSMKSGSIDAAVLTAGSITATQIGAATITADNLILGQGVNLLFDPSFLVPEANAIRASRSSGTWTFPIDSNTKMTSARTTTASTNTQFMFGTLAASAANASKLIPAVAGEEYLLSASIQSSAIAAARWFVQTVTAEGVVASNTSLKLYEAATDTWTANASYISAAGKRNLIAKWTVPANVVAFSPIIQTTTQGIVFVVDGGASVVRKVEGNLIVDGAIDGKTITGALIQSVSTANRGIKLSDTQFVAYNSSGVETVRLDGSNSILTGATVRTAASGARVQMSSAGLEAWDSSNVKYLTANSSGLTLMGTIISEGDTADTGLVPSNGEAFRTRATVGRRRTGSVSAIDLTPGIWFESEKYSGSGSPIAFKALPAGVSASDDLASGVTMHSGKNLTSSGGASIGITYLDSRIEVEGDSINGYRMGTDFNMTRWMWELKRYGSTHNLEQYFKAGTNSSDTANDGWMELMSIYGIKLDAPNIEINGRSQKYVGPTLISILNGFAHHTGSGWTGVRYTVSGDVVEITGAFTKASYADGNVIGTIPAAYRPTASKKGINADINTAGQVILTVSGSGAQTISIVFVK